MNRTAVIAAVISLVGSVVSAQPTTMGVAAGPGFELALAKAAVETSGTAVRITVDFRPLAEAAAPATLNPATLIPAANRVWTIEGQTALTFRYRQPEAAKARKGAVDWLGLFTEELRMDAIMHLKRLTEPKTRREVERSSYFGGYAQAVKGYLTTGWRWSDGDPFMTAYVMHPFMGAVYTQIYRNHDSRCAGVEFGDAGYWACTGRSALFGAFASANWEWNPLLSESALGHVGKFYTCANGKCTGEGGWTDFVATPLGGIGIRIAGDIARAKLWPKLDKHLSGNLAARILKVAVKVMTDPSRLVNAAANMNFQNAFASRIQTGRR